MEDGKPLYFDSLPIEQQEKILNTKMLIYICNGTEKEIKEWFKTINIAGIPLNEQELLNAVFSGEFVTLAKAEFSNSQNVQIQKWSAYINGSALRQDFLAKALEWVSKGNISDYMSQHRHDNNINELKLYFNTVIDWVSNVFNDVEKEMKGLEWGRLYETYKNTSYNPQDVSTKVKELYLDPYIKNRKGIFEYILGGSVDTKLLDVRVFDEATKKAVYQQQTEKAKKENISNCPLCAVGNNPNKNKVWTIKEMEADHVAAWSKGGSTSLDNCEMLCMTHNRAKGNR